MTVFPKYGLVIRDNATEQELKDLQVRYPDLEKTIKKLLAKLEK
jgi:hypothetical protein